MLTKAEYNRRNAALLREPELAAEIRQLRTERDEARGKLRIAEKAQVDVRMREVARQLLIRLSNSTAHLMRYRDVELEHGYTLPMSVIQENIAAQEAAVALGIEND